MAHYCKHCFPPWAVHGGLKHAGNIGSSRFFSFRNVLSRRQLLLMRFVRFRSSLGATWCYIKCDWRETCGFFVLLSPFLSWENPKWYIRHYFCNFFACFATSPMNSLKLSCGSFQISFKTLHRSPAFSNRVTWEFWWWTMSKCGFALETSPFVATYRARVYYLSKLQIMPLRSWVFMFVPAFLLHT